MQQIHLFWQDKPCFRKPLATMCWNSWMYWDVKNSYWVFLQSGWITNHGVLIRSASNFAWFGGTTFEAQTLGMMAGSFERWSTAHRHLGEIDLRVSWIGWISWSAGLGPLNVPTDFNTQQAHVWQEVLFTFFTHLGQSCCGNWLGRLRRPVGALKT